MAPVCECELTGEQRLVDGYGDCAHCGKQAADIGCPLCGSRVAVVVGRMAHRTHYRCRDCGMTYGVRGEVVVV